MGQICFVGKHGCSKLLQGFARQSQGVGYALQPLKCWNSLPICRFRPQPFCLCLCILIGCRLENFCRTTKRLQSRSSSQTTVQVKQEKLWVKLVTLQRRKGLSPRLELCLRHTLKLAMALCQSCVQESHM